MFWQDQNQYRAGNYSEQKTANRAFERDQRFQHNQADKAQAKQKYGDGLLRGWEFRNFICDSRFQSG